MPSFLFEMFIDGCYNALFLVSFFLRLKYPFYVSLFERHISNLLMSLPLLLWLLYLKNFFSLILEHFIFMYGRFCLVIW